MCLLTYLKAQIQSLELTWYKDAMEFYKLSPDHHMDTVVQIHTPMLYTNVNKYI